MWSVWIVGCKKSKCRSAVAAPWARRRRTSGTARASFNGAPRPCACRRRRLACPSARSETERTFLSLFHIAPNLSSTTWTLSKCFYDKLILRIIFKIRINFIKFIYIYLVYTTRYKWRVFVEWDFAETILSLMLFKSKCEVEWVRWSAARLRSLRFSSACQPYRASVSINFSICMLYIPC